MSFSLSFSLLSQFFGLVCYFIFFLLYSSSYRPNMQDLKSTVQVLGQDFFFLQFWDCNLLQVPHLYGLQYTSSYLQKQKQINKYSQVWPFLYLFFLICHQINKYVNNVYNIILWLLKLILFLMYNINKLI